MKTRDLVALCIVIGLILWGLATIIGLWWNKQSLSEGGGQILLPIAVALSGALTTYFSLKKDEN